MDKRLTSNDIAELACVSQTTVSLVLRNKWKGRVSPAVAEKILNICNENNYRVNHAARSLRSGHAKNIALVVPDSENPFFSRILHNLRRVSSKQSYVCLLIETDNNPNWYSYIEDSILGNEIDIAIVCYNDLPRRNSAIDKQIILINDYFLDFNSISIDFFTAVKDGVGRLFKKGYKQLVHVRGMIEKPTFTSRIVAFNEACAELGVFHNDIVIQGHTNNDLEGKLETAKSSFTYPTAFFIDDDLFAPGLYKFSQKHGLTIGRDIGVISLDDTFLCSFFTPSLSSYGYDINIMVEKIMEIIDKIHSGEQEPEHFTISMYLNSGSSF